MGTAVILTNGKLAHGDAKTAHGLIRGTKRFDIVGVIDEKHVGQDAGDVIENKEAGIPVFESLEACIDKTGHRPRYAIIGVALTGGMLSPDWEALLLDTIEHGIGIINGLHQSLSSFPRLKSAAQKHGQELVDMRKPRPLEDLRFWTGEIYRITTPSIAVLGTDCAIGKRTTCQYLVELCQSSGISTEMIYTGQTGWLQGYPHGFILDATPNDFVSGELERAMVDCAREIDPDLMLVEGQSALRNPAGPCGSEMLLSGNIKGVILVHAPFRTYYEDHEDAGCVIPAIESEIELIRAYGAETLGVVLNTQAGDPEALRDYQTRLSEKLNLPVIRPLEEGVGALLPVLRRFIGHSS